MDQAAAAASCTIDGVVSRARSALASCGYDSAVELLADAECLEAALAELKAWDGMLMANNMWAIATLLGVAGPRAAPSALGTWTVAGVLEDREGFDEPVAVSTADLETDTLGELEFRADGSVNGELGGRDFASRWSAGPHGLQIDGVTRCSIDELRLELEFTDDQGLGRRFDPRRRAATTPRSGR